MREPVTKEVFVVDEESPGKSSWKSASNFTASLRGKPTSEREVSEDWGEIDLAISLLFYDFLPIPFDGCQQKQIEKEIAVVNEQSENWISGKELLVGHKDQRLT